MSDLNITREGIEVQPGQVWRDLDKRMHGRTVIVVSVRDGKATVTCGPRTTRISVSRMHRSSTGFELVTQ